MKTSIASLFGLTQREMAMALGIGYSQWSMYECGKRNLPERAQHLLNEMTAHMHASKTVTKQSEDLSKNQNRILHVQSLLEDNAYKQHLLTKKITAVTRKQASAQHYAGFNDFVNKRKADKEKANQVPMWIPIYKKQREVQANDNDLLFQLELRQVLLIQEQKALESKLFELTKKSGTKS